MVILNVFSVTNSGTKERQSWGVTKRETRSWTSEALTLIRFLLPHWEILFKSECTAVETRRSSNKSKWSRFKRGGRVQSWVICWVIFAKRELLIGRRKRIGDKTETWRTQLLIRTEGDADPSTVPEIDRPEKTERGRRAVNGNFRIKPLCKILWKAF